MSHGDPSPIAGGGAAGVKKTGALALSCGLAPKSRACSAAARRSSSACGGTTTGGGGGGGDTTARDFTSPTPGDEADDESMDDAPLDELYPSPAASFTGGHPDGPN